MDDTLDIYSVFAETARNAGDRTALIYLGTRYSYRGVHGPQRSPSGLLKKVLAVSKSPFTVT